MITTNVLPTWRIAQTADGVILSPPEGPELGTIQIRENQRPLVTVARLFATENVECGPLERLITCEGELAAVQIQRGAGADGRAFVRCLGAVVGDDLYTVIDAHTMVSERFSFFEHAARAFTFYMSLGLGYRRQRRFEYWTPVGWSGVARGLDAVWMPPGFPGVSARITVHAAQPVGASATDLRDSIIKRLELSGLSSIKVGDAERRLTEGSPLNGLAWRATGSEEGIRKHVDVVVLEDERFLYPLELVASAEHIGETRAVFDYLVYTSRGIPVPPAAPPTSTVLLWTP